MEHLHYPNESAEYRAARNALLDDAITLRAQIEAVAAKRRALPLGGEVSEDYVFERIGKTSMPEKVKMSELFGPHDTLVLYSFMYGPERELPCPGCTHLLDGLDGAARHVGERAALYIVAKSPIAECRLVLPKAQAPQPDHNVHRARRNLGYRNIQNTTHTPR